MLELRMPASQAILVADGGKGGKTRFRKNLKSEETKEFEAKTNWQNDQAHPQQENDSTSQAGRIRQRSQKPPTGKQSIANTTHTNQKISAESECDI